MLLHRALAFGCLLASTALAHRRYGQRQSHLLGHVERSTDQDTVYSTKWAGATRLEGRGTFHHVEATFIVPHVSGTSGTNATVWVGIDGSSCNMGILGTGIHLAPDKSPYAWLEWYPDQFDVYSGLPINAGDKVKLSVTAYSATKGFTKVINLSSGKSAEKHLSSSHVLCMQDVEWIVEDFTRGDRAPNFGTITFEDAKALDHYGKAYEPAGGRLYYTRRNGKILATASTNGDTVTVQYDSA